MAVRIDNSTVSDRAWGDVDKAALALRLSLPDLSPISSPPNCPVALAASHPPRVLWQVTLLCSPNR